MSAWGRFSRWIVREVLPVFRNPWPLLAAVAIIFLWHTLGYWRDAVAVARFTSSQYPTVQLPRDLDMASWTAAWRSNGEPQSVTTTQSEGQTVAEAFEVHKEAVRLAKEEYPPDAE